MADTKPVRGRFAPSPSGRMHLGNLFCALMAWLPVRAANGEMVLRIEDLDPGRSRMEYAMQMEEDLRWFGLDWDEGGSSGGPFGPYYQSQRTQLYEKCFSELREKGLVYPCYCTRGELHAAQAPHREDGMPVYSGRCRHLSEEERAKLSQRRRPAFRLEVPNREIHFTDGYQGSYTENLAHDCGDFIIRRSDGVFAYQLAVVADDGEMGITQVVRGCDLLDSTPRQLYLYELLGYSAPQFYHIPLMMSEDGRRLSKRDHDQDLGFLRSIYHSPEPLLGLLGNRAGLLDRPEPVTARELVEEFRKKPPAFFGITECEKARPQLSAL